MRALTPLTAILLLGMCTTAAYGDGGSMLLHQDSGPFTITLFVVSQPLTVGAADMSVMVQDRSSGNVLLDTEIQIRAALAADKTSQIIVGLTKAHAGNRLLQGASVRLSRAGNWQLTVLVRRGKDVVHVSALVTVEPDTSRTALIWFYVLLPVAVIAIFLIHQALKD